MDHGSVNRDAHTPDSMLYEFGGYKMRLILLTLMISALALFTACQSAASSSELESKNPADEKKSTETADKTATEPEAKADDHSDQEHGDEAPRISLADAKKDFDADKAVFIDTRSESAYNNEHIKGSINISSSDVESKYKNLPKDKKLIAYCS